MENLGWPRTAKWDGMAGSIAVALELVDLMEQMETLATGTEISLVGTGSSNKSRPHCSNQARKREKKPYLTAFALSNSEL